MSFANMHWPKSLGKVKAASAKPLSGHDKALLNQLMEMLNGQFISFYKNHDFRGSFMDTHWHPLSQFVDAWHDVTHEFIDVDLEAFKKRLYDEAENLASLIAKYTTSDIHGICSIYPDRQISEELRNTFKAEGKLINDACPAFVEQCESFVRYARVRLADG